ncbi:hypothetical protein ECOK1180_0019, partial [Escherichia coli OK1180]
MEVVIGDLVGFVFNNIYTSTALQGRQWKIFQQGKIEGLITFCTELQVTKNPPERGFISRLRLVTAKHTVLCQH